MNIHMYTYIYTYIYIQATAVGFTFEKLQTTIHPQYIMCLLVFIVCIVGCKRDPRKPMNEARLSHLPFWGPSEAVFFLIKRPVGLPE